jgi:RNA polymerase sigma factor (sigma-70 family)
MLGSSEFGASDFGTWYRANHAGVLATLTLTAGSTEVAEDVTAEAFARAFEHWDRVRTMEAPRGWLYKVALNLLRRRGRRLALERDLLRRTPAPETPPPALDPELWQAVKALPERQRTAVALRYVLDLPEADVAQIMGTTRGSASASLTTARRRLEALLTRPEPDLEEV